MSKPDYDTSLARMAGNIAAGILANPEWRGPSVRPMHNDHEIAESAVDLARLIVKRLRASDREEGS